MAQRNSRLRQRRADRRPGSISVSVDPTGLAAGIYSGDVNVSIGALLQSVNVTFVVRARQFFERVYAVDRALQARSGRLRREQTGDYRNGPGQ